MPRTGDINRSPGVYISLCCGIERSIPNNMKVPPCPGHHPADQGECAGHIASWTFLRHVPNV